MLNVRSWEASCRFHSGGQGACSLNSPASLFTHMSSDRKLVVRGLDSLISCWFFISWFLGPSQFFPKLFPKLSWRFFLLSWTTKYQVWICTLLKTSYYGHLVLKMKQKVKSSKMLFKYDQQGSCSTVYLLMLHQQGLIWLLIKHQSIWIPAPRAPGQEGH